MQRRTFLKMSAPALIGLGVTALPEHHSASLVSPAFAQNQRSDPFARRLQIPMLAHPFHVHDTQFRVMARSHGNLSATEQGLKDTVLVYPQEKVRLMIPFPEYTDSERPYMYHCHILEHEDGGMMGQFTVEAG